MTDEPFTLESIADGIRKRLAQPRPDYQGIAAELVGAKRMALALGDEQAVEQVHQLHCETLNAWSAATEDDRPEAAVHAS